MMLTAFPQSAVVNVDGLIHAYMFAVEDLEFVDVASAIKRIMQGGEGHEGRAFVPSTAELCQEARRRKQMREIMQTRGLQEVGMTGKMIAIEGGKK